ncbi:caf1 family ribonuclease domain-containing protein [Cyclospora cayetanensis]|uniref:Caf1 family ribonuclease domain-containing protein n=1 Tax=Cyclospora cayetanensis TaxID=88456 RepID=A0A1D3CRS4_9EIME|nr:caf1 family ribonuclease domain-containing protein [Cyclospora cayetanensis]
MAEGEEDADDVSSSANSLGGLSVLAEALIEAEVPIVLHNGLLDLLHLMEKFVQEIPPTLPLFASEVARLFIGGIFDTKYIATHLTPCSTFGRTALQALRNHLLAAPGLNCCFIIDESCKSAFDFSFKELNVANEMPDARSHEAGFDALATAQVFVCLAAFEAKVQQRDVCISLLSKARDIIGVAGVHPGYIKLQSYQQEEPRAGVLKRDSSGGNGNGSISSTRRSEDKGIGKAPPNGIDRAAPEVKRAKRDRAGSASPPRISVAVAAAERGEGGDQITASPGRRRRKAL